MDFPPSPNTWKVRAVAAHLGLPLELEFVDLSQGQPRTRRTIWRSIRPAARRRWSTAISSSGNRPRSCSTSRAGQPNALWPDDCAHPRRHHALAELAPRALGQGGVRSADLRAAGEEVRSISVRPTPPRVAEGTRVLQQARRRVLDAHLGEAALSRRPERSRSRISRSRHRCSTPRQADLPLAPYAQRARLVRPRLRRCRAWQETAPQLPAAAAA